MEPVLRLSVRPQQWDELDAARAEAVSFLRRHAFGEATIQAAEMVVCELTENATKYGAFEENPDPVDVAITVQGATVTIEVRSRVRSASDEHLRRLERAVQWIRGFQNPFEAYVEKLKEVSSQSLESNESGLGLVRIAYEGQSILDFFLLDQNVLSVSAVHRSQA
jgi:hypothetical protein